MDKEINNKIRRNSFYNILYNLFNALFPLISAAYIARILSPSGVGLAAYVQNVASYFVALVPLGIPTYGQKVVSQCEKNNNDELSNTFSELLFINGISTAIFSLSYYVMIFSIPYFGDNRLLYSVAGISIIANLFNVDWFYRGLEKFKYITIRNFIVKVLSFVLVIVIVHDVSHIVWYLLIVCGITSLNNIVNFVHSRKYVKLSFKIDWGRVKEHMKPIMFLFVSLIASDVYSKMDVTMLGLMCGEETVGYYTSAFRIITIVITVITSITAVSLPQLSNYAKDSNKKALKTIMTNLLNIVMVLSFAAGAGVFLVSKNVILVLYGGSYEASINVLKILSFILIIKGIGDLLAYQQVVAIGKERLLVPIRFASVLINGVLNYFLIKTMKQEGAALATVITELITLVYVLLVLKKENYARLKLKNIISIIVSLAVMAATVFVTQFFIENIYFALMVGVVCGVLTYSIPLFILKNDVFSFLFGKKNGDGFVDV